MRLLTLPYFISSPPSQLIPPSFLGRRFPRDQRTQGPPHLLSCQPNTTADQPTHSLAIASLMERLVACLAEWCHSLQVQRSSVLHLLQQQYSLQCSRYTVYLVLFLSMMSCASPLYCFTWPCQPRSQATPRFYWEYIFFCFVFEIKFGHGLGMR